MTRLKSPLLVPATAVVQTCSAVLPRLVKVTVEGVLGDPTGRLPKFKLVGETLVAAPLPVRATA